MAGTVLYQLIVSPYCAKVRWALEYKRVEYEAVEVDPLGRRAAKTASGQRRVPVLDLDGTVIADSTAILARLDDAVPDRPLLPPDAAVRARLLALEDWADEVFISDLIAFAMLSGDNHRRLIARTLKHLPPDALTVVRRWFGPLAIRRIGRARARGRSLARLRADHEHHLDVLEGMLDGRGFLAGGTPTVFDAAVWGGLWSMRGMVGEELLAPRTRLSAWYRRMKDAI